MLILKKAALPEKLKLTVVEDLSFMWLLVG